MDTRKSWFRRNWLKAHFAGISMTLGIFEFLAPKLAARAHQFILHLLWVDIVHRIGRVL